MWKLDVENPAASVHAGLSTSLRGPRGDGPGAASYGQMADRAGMPRRWIQPSMSVSFTLQPMGSYSAAFT